MSTDLTPERRAEIERRSKTDAIAVELCRVFRERMRTAHKRGHGEINMRLGTLKNITDSIEALNIRCNQLEAQRQQAERERDLLAETARRLTGERDTLATFARKVIESSSFRGCDADGGDVQEWAVEAGILRPVVVMQACREDSDGCACAEFGFPTTCYRFTARAAAAPEERR